MIPHGEAEHYGRTAAYDPPTSVLCLKCMKLRFIDFLRFFFTKGGVEEHFEKQTTWNKLPHT